MRELTHQDNGGKTSQFKAWIYTLDLAAGGRHVVLTVIHEIGEDLPAQFDRVSVSSLN